MLALAVAAIATLLLITGYMRDWGRLSRRPRIDPPGPCPTHPPLVSLLIPARNEERAIARCVFGALNQAYPRLEVLVVDDGSTDRTGAILREIQAAGQGGPPLRVLAGQPLPHGWVGKTNVCQQLGEAARGEWLLFLDADTAPQAELVSALLTHAEARGLDMVTVFPFLELGSFWERVILPPFLAFITALYPPERMERPDARPEEVLANGQCIFVRREAYAAIGGHGAVRDEVLEDVHLAQALRRAGFRLGGGEGMALLRVRMYTNGRDVAAGMMKHAAAGQRNGGTRSTRMALLTLLLAFGPFWLLGAGLALAAQSAGAPAWGVLALGALSFGTALAFWGSLYRTLYNLSPVYALIWPFGVLTYLLIAGWGLWQVRRGRGVVWKGRRYAG